MQGPEVLSLEIELFYQVYIKSIFCGACVIGCNSSVRESALESFHTVIDRDQNQDCCVFNIPVYSTPD